MIAKGLKTAAQLNPGETGYIQGFAQEKTATRLLELGCLPGTKITLIRAVPFNGPCYLKINGGTFALRKEEAHNILLKNK